MIWLRRNGFPSDVQYAQYTRVLSVLSFATNRPPVMLIGRVPNGFDETIALIEVTSNEGFRAVCAAVIVTMAMSAVATDNVAPSVLMPAFLPEPLKSVTPEGVWWEDKSNTRIAPS
jgi:hypothetical protein